MKAQIGAAFVISGEIKCVPSATVNCELATLRRSLSRVIAAE